MFFKNILREFNIFLHCIIIRPYEFFVYDINNKKRRNDSIPPFELYVGLISYLSI